MTCGSTSRRTMVQLLPPRVCALATSSGGNSMTRLAMSRTITGATPTAISVILAVSPRPSAMNRIGSSASGGMTQTTVTKGSRNARTRGMKPMAMPKRKRGERGNAHAREQPEETGIGVDPQDEVAGALVRNRRKVQEGRPHLCRRGQQLVVGVDGQPLRRGDQIGDRHDQERQGAEEQGAAARDLRIDQAKAHLRPCAGKGARCPRRPPRAASFMVPIPSGQHVAPLRAFRPPPPP